MSKTKKMFEVHDLLIKANDLLAASTGTPEFRRGVATMLEGVLHATGNYAGYNFIGWTTEGGCDRWLALGDADAPKASYIGDETRRFYYYSQKMCEVQRALDAT